MKDIIKTCEEHKGNKNKTIGQLSNTQNAPTKGDKK
jgi:hypothetical protein